MQSRRYEESQSRRPMSTGFRPGNVFDCSHPSGIPCQDQAPTLVAAWLFQGLPGHLLLLVIIFFPVLVTGRRTESQTQGDHNLRTLAALGAQVHEALESATGQERCQVASSGVQTSRRCSPFEGLAKSALCFRRQRCSWNRCQLARLSQRTHLIDYSDDSSTPHSPPPHTT